MFGESVNPRRDLSALLSAPVPTTLAVLALALGVGANVAIYSAVRGVLLSSLPYADPDRIVRVWTEHSVSPELYQLLDERMTTVRRLDASQSVSLALIGSDEAWDVPAGQVTAEHFALLGVRPEMGRALSRDDQRPGAEPVVVLSHEFWRDHFGGEPGIVGRQVQLGDETSPWRTVVGVMPPGLRPLEASWQAWIPLVLDPSNEEAWSHNYGLRLHARLGEGATVTAAAGELRAVATQLAAEHVGLFMRAPESASVARLLDVAVGDLRMQLTLLAGAGLLVLVVACANVANLQLAQGIARQRELAVRTALGADRGRLIRQMLGESAMLGLLGATAGAALAFGLVELLGLVPADLPRGEGVRIDVVVLVFALCLGVLSGLIAGVLPALRASQANPQGVLIDGGRSIGSAGRRRLQGGLVMLEVALAVVLVVGAGLLLRSAWRLQQVDPGFRYQQLVSVRLSPPISRYGSGADRSAYYDRVLERLARVPGVEAAGAAALLPLAGGRMGVGFDIDDAATDRRRATRADYNPVAGPYLETLGVPLLSGRWLDAADGGRPRPTAVLVNRAFASEYFPGSDPLGHRLTDEGNEWMRIVGVVGDIRQRQLDANPAPAIYAPYLQDPLRRLFVVVRTSGDPQRLAPVVRAAIADVDPLVPIDRLSAMTDVVTGSLARTRLFTALLAGFAVLALALGAVGIYGVVSFAVSQRTREIGMRMALGADRNRVVGTILKSGLRPVAIGLLAGLGLAALGGQLLSAYLYEVTTDDPVTFAAVALGVLLVGLVAAFGPARRAARLDPLDALRAD